MTITTVRLSTQSIVIVVDTDSLEDFKKLINKGLNTWDRAHPELKKLGDLVTTGQVQQDYYSQDSSSYDI